MRPLRDESLREQATEAIRAEIVTGGLEPGAVYSAPNLARQLGVSATPIREAMLDLTKEGLVEVVRNRGFRVIELSDADLDDIGQIRDFLEVPAVGLLAGRLSGADAARLIRLAETIEAAASASDLGAFVLADRRFHLTLIGLAGNPRLVQLVGQFRDLSRLYGLRRLVTEGSLMASAAEHRLLLQATMEGDRRLAERLMRNHIRHVRGSWAGMPETPTSEGSEDTSGRLATMEVPE